MAKVGKKKSTKRGAKGGPRNDRAAVIMQLFRSFPSRKFALKTLAAQSGGADREGRYQTKAIVYQMVEEGVVEATSASTFRLAARALPTVEGYVQMLASGSLYVVVEGADKDIFVDKRNASRALDGDKVRVAIVRRRASGDPEGQIVEVVERAERNYVGVVEKTRSHAFVRVVSKNMPVDIFIDKGVDKLADGDKVVARIISWEAESKCPTGRVVEVLGKEGDNTAEMHAILAEFGLPYDFPREVEEEAERISDRITEKEYASRRDFRDVVTFTIDPADAKDFDDALSFRTLDSGNVEVGVHIADVTHYVKEGSLVEQEARERATSVYLVDRTIPMLPERLSNELCSLRPDEEKLCFSAVFELDSEARVVREWFGRTVILSNRRFTYEEAQRIIEGEEGDFKQEILTLNGLAQKLRQRRFAEGAIGFDREEAKFALDENGKPLGVYFKVQKEANQLIEEFMLLANRSVSAFIGSKKGKNGRAKTFVYRVHDKPDGEKLARFANFILKFGYYFDARKGREVANQMNALMGQIKGKSEENVVSILAVRTMQKAYYSTENIGHYGLAFPYYSHFTSPIRRYPDMMLHRLLAHYLDGGHSVDSEVVEELCEHSSEMEARAAEAERASVKYKMVEFMKERIGQEFEGSISGVTEWGLYVELEETHIEGMVAMRDLSDEFYAFDEEEYAAVGTRSGRKFVLGDRVKIRVKSADLRLKQLDFEMVGSYDNKGVWWPLQERLNSEPENGSRRAVRQLRKRR
ncbi:MAG: ribonuclease R [Tidjanibacter sp.]|nr:ribonuclease R [Tidjanibacter sp.]